MDADYRRETVYIYEHLGTPDKSLISFVGEEHMMIYSDEAVAKMKHFAAAFFGYYLQGNEDYAAISRKISSGGRKTWRGVCIRKNKPDEDLTGLGKSWPITPGQPVRS